MPATKTKISETLRLHARIREVQVDDDGGMRAVCVMLQEGPGNPVDGHYYTGELIDAIASEGTFEGARSFADHANEVEERASGGVRSVRDLLGWWSDVHVEEAAGKKLLVGTYNVETGNAFAANKLREAKKYAERYKDDPSKQYIGFSIYAGGTSERAEIDGKPYNVVLSITEAGSTDMVSSAGAGGKLLTLQEAQMSVTLASKRDEKKLLESLIDGISKKLKPGLAREAGKKLTEAKLTAAIAEAFDQVAESLDDDLKPHMDKMKKTVAAHVAKAMTSEPPKDDEDEEDETGDPTLDDILEPDDDDGTETDDDEEPEDGEKLGEEDEMEASMMGGKKKEAAISARERELLAENQALRLREKARSVRERARKLVAEAKVPASIRGDVLTFMVENCKSEKSMRAYLGTIKPSFTESGVVGNGARTRESGARAGGLMTVSGVEKAS